MISVALNIQKHVHNKLIHQSTVSLTNEDDEEEQEPLLSNSYPRKYFEVPLWWAGLLVMTLGEAGNFISYGFASAVLVAPLGTVALISNALIAPFFLGEM